MSPLPPTRDSAHASSAGFAGGVAAHGSRRGRRWVKGISIFLGVALAVLVGGLGAMSFFFKSQIDELVTPKSPEMVKAQKLLEAPLPGQPTNILLLGSDHRKSTSAAGDQRSDTLLLVRLDPKRRSISMISFPRDLYVPIPGHGTSKINDAYSLGGPALSIDTIKQLTGLDINMAMNVDFTGFRGVIDQLGGVWVDVDRTYFNNQQDQVSDVDLKPGYQLLKGRDALAYARFRHDARGDFNRIARQQQVIGGLKKQVGSSSMARNVPGLFQVFRKNTEVASGGGDSIDARVLYDYLRLALKLDSRDMYQVEYEGLTGRSGAGASIVVYDEAKMDAAVKAFLAPDSKAREQSADQLVGEEKATTGAADPAAGTAPAMPVEPDPSTVSVKVLNGSGIGGVARSMAQQLTAAGYKVDPEQTNADNSNYASTRVFYANNRAKPAAEALAKRIDGASTAMRDGSNAFATQLLVVVGKLGTKVADAESGTGDVVGADEGPDGGQSYAGNKVPERAKPMVMRDTELARDEYVELRTARMPILYPTVFEQTSSVEELYPYQFTKGDTTYDNYRLVASTASGDFWGLQATSWSEPPILEDPTREVQRAGRAYRLYFNGTKLHMVAWRQGSGTYWVSNSVLNNLSNETMLAIADGVKPLRAAR